MPVLKQMSTLSPLSIVLLGEKQSGRSLAGNTILGRSEFQVDGILEPLTVGSGDVEGRGVTVVNTPGWKPGCHPKVPLRILDRGCGRVSWDTGQGPHALLLTIPIYFKMRWNEKVAQRLLKLFDDNIWRHTILLFTRADQLGLMNLDRYLEGSGRPLQALVEKCERRYHALNNRTIDNRKQVIELLDKIDQMVAENGGKTFQLIDSSWEEKASQTEAPKMIVLEEQLKEMMERQAKLEKELHEWRERQRPEECMVRSLRQEEEYPDFLPELNNLQCNPPLQNEIRQQVEMQEFWAEKELQNQQSVDQIEHLREYEWSEKEPTVTQACEDRVGSLSEDECLGHASSRNLSMTSNDEEELRRQNESDSNDTNRAEGLTVMEKYADPEDKIQRKAIRTEKQIDAFEEVQRANKIDCSGAAFIVIYNQIGSHQQGAVRTDVLQVFICWKNPNPSFQTASVSFIICCVGIDWALFVIQFLFVSWLYLISKQPKTGVQNEDTLVFPMDQQLPAMEKHQREHQKDSVLLNGGDWTENLDGGMLQPSKTGEDEGIPQHNFRRDDEGIPQNNGISDHISTNSRLNDNEEMPQYNLRGHDRATPTYSRNRDEGLPQRHKNGDGGRISDYSWGSSDEWIPQHILKGKEKKSQNRDDSKQSNDDGTCQYHRKKDDGEMPQLSKKEDNRGLPKHKLRDDDGGKPQHSSKKDDRWKPSYNIKKNDESRAEHSWGRDEEGIPYYNIKRDDKWLPQLSKKKGEGGILQHYRKKSDWNVPQCRRRKSDGGTPQQQRKGDDRIISQHCCMKSEGTSRQYNTKGNNGGIHQFKTKGDGGIPQHHSNRNSRKKGNREKLSHSMNEDDTGIAQHSRKNGGRGMPQHGKDSDEGIPKLSRKNDNGDMFQHSRKNGDGEVSQHSGKNGVGEMPQRSRKNGDGEVPQRSRKNGDGEVPQRSRKNGDGEVPQRSRKNGDGEVPQRSTKNGDGEVPQRSTKNGDGEVSQHSGKNGDGEMPQRSGKNGDGEMPQRSGKNGDGEVPQRSRKNGDGEVPQRSTKNGDGEVPQRSTKNGDGEVPQRSMKNGDGEVPQRSRKNGDGEVPQRSTKNGDGEVPQRSMKNGDGEVSQHSGKNGDGEVPQRSTKNGDGEVPQRSTKNGDGEVPQRSTKNGDGEVPQRSMKNGDGEVPQRSTKNGDGEVPQRSTKNGDGEVPQRSMKNGDGEVSQHSGKNGDGEVPQRSTKNGDGEVPQRSTKNGDGEVPQRSTKNGDRRLPHHSRKISRPIGDDIDVGTNPKRGFRGHRGAFQCDQKCDEQFLVKREEFGREGKARRSQSLERIVKLSCLGESDMRQERSIRKTRRSKSLKRFIDFSCSTVYLPGLCVDACVLSKLFRMLQQTDFCSYFSTASSRHARPELARPCLWKRHEAKWERRSLS
ncbi:hypothetical protein AOLI_G00104480 [Acnodon oligacanthus]